MRRRLLLDMTTDQLFDPTPVHLVASAGDNEAICGARDPLPKLLARFAKERPRVTLCEACVAAPPTGEAEQ